MKGNNNLFQAELVNEALKQSFIKLHPFKNVPKSGNVYGVHRDFGYGRSMYLDCHG
ncbi:hypothetical protein QF024_002760 [Chryseobacterium nepalense]|nr:hypothetical protein [Chryseobacterium nepalense]